MNDGSWLISRLDTHDEVQRKDVITELIAIGENAVPALINALENSRPRIRGGAALALGKLSLIPTSEPAVEILARMLSDESEFVQTCASVALAEFDDLAERPLIEAVADKLQPTKQARAAIALRQMRRSSPAAILALINNLSHPDEFVRRQSALALAHVGNCPAEVRMLFHRRNGDVEQQTLVTNSSIELIARLIDFAADGDNSSLAEELVVALCETGDTSATTRVALVKVAWLCGGRAHELACKQIEALFPELELRHERGRLWFKMDDPQLIEFAFKQSAVERNRE